MTEHGEEAILRLACALRLHPRVFGDRLFANQIFALLRLTCDLLGLFEKIDKDGDLRPQNVGNDRRENVIDRAQRVSARNVIHRVVDRAHKNDRSCLAALPLSN